MTFSTDRRSMLKLGLAGAAGGLAAPQIMTRTAYGQFDMPQPAGRDFYRFDLGDLTVTTILDGMRPGEGPHPTFGADQPSEAVAELMRENFLPADRMVNPFTPVLVGAGSELVLFDTGLGEGGREAGMGKLRERMQAAGHAPEEVTVVVLTHFHGDHVGGLMENGSPAFPNARYVMGEKEFEFWTAPERMSGPTEGGARTVAEKVVPLAENATFVADGAEVVPGITAMEAFGHTPGHMIFRLDSGGDSLILTADTANHFVASLRRPDWHVRFDMDKDAAAATRKRVFDMIAADRLPFIGYHMPFPAVGYVEKLDTGYRYVPESYQLQL
jgi:glyoxylase-like metal-dependent hydrolase (beta-lactamase superfamily II)